MAPTFLKYVFVIFGCLQLGLQEKIDNTVTKLSTEDASTRKSTTIYDYHTRMSAYKDLVESGCYIEFIKNGEPFLSHKIREFPLKKLPRELYISKEKLSKRTIWELAGPRIWEFCRGFPTYLIQEVKDSDTNDINQDDNDILKTRVRRRRSTRHYFVGRLRGQTQSQYMNFGNSVNSTGKAEAESAYGGSRASVVGTNGMGQAQSQSSPFDCDECYTPIRTSEYEPVSKPGVPGPGELTHKKPSVTGVTPSKTFEPGQTQKPGVYQQYPEYSKELIPGRGKDTRYPASGHPEGAVAEIVPSGSPGQIRPGTANKPGNIYQGYPTIDKPGFLPERPAGAAGDLSNKYPPRYPGSSDASTFPGSPSGLVIEGVRYPGVSPEINYPTRIPSQPSIHPSQTGSRNDVSTARDPTLPSRRPGDQEGISPNFPSKTWQPDRGQIIYPEVAAQPEYVYPGSREDTGYPTGISDAQGSKIDHQRPNGNYFGRDYPTGGGNSGRFSGQFSGTFDINGKRLPQGAEISPTGRVIIPGYGDTVYPSTVSAQHPIRSPERPIQPIGPPSISSPNIYTKPLVQYPTTGYEKPYDTAQITTVHGTVNKNVAATGTVPGRFSGYFGGTYEVPSTYYPGIARGQQEFPLRPNYGNHLNQVGRYPQLPGSGYDQTPFQPGTTQLQYPHHIGIGQSQYSPGPGFEQKPSQDGKITGQRKYPHQIETGQAQFPKVTEQSQYPYVTGREPSTYPHTPGIGQVQYPQSTETGQEQYPQEAGTGHAQYPHVTGTGQVQYPHGTEHEQYPQVAGTGQVRHPHVTETGQVRYPQVTGRGQEQYSQVTGTGQAQHPHITGTGQEQYPQLTGIGQAQYPHVTRTGQEQYPQVTGTGQVQYPHLTGTEQEQYPQVSGTGQEQYPFVTGTGQVQYPHVPETGQTQYPSIPKYGQESSRPDTTSGIEQYPTGQQQYQPGLNSEDQFGIVSGQTPSVGRQTARQPAPSVGGKLEKNDRSPRPYPPGEISGQSPYQPAQGSDELGIPKQPSETTQDGDSQAQTSVQQTNNETQANAQAQGTFAGGMAQSQVSGTYSGSGSFSASAGSDDGNKGALTQISGGAQGASSAAQGHGGKGKSQAQMQLFSDSGKIISAAQSGGSAYGSQTQVQGGEEGGMANAQSSGLGRTSSQAQIGFSPHTEDNSDNENQKNYFQGGGTANAQGGSSFGQSQSQIQGKFRYGIKYSGGAQAQSGNENKNFTYTPFAPLLNIKPITLLPFIPTKTENPNEAAVETDGIPSENQTIQTNQELPSSTERRNNVDNPSTQSALKAGEDEDDNGEDYYYDNEAEQSAANKIITQTRDGQTQNIVLPNMRNLNARVVQTNFDKFHERVFEPGDTFQPGELIPGTSGYRIPQGFRGKIKSVASPSETYAVGKSSQAQTVTITPGTGKITYQNAKNKRKNNNRYRSSYTHEPYQYYFRSGEPLPNFLSISKSETGYDNPITGRRVSSTHYTQSSTCGIITNTCIFRNTQRICLPNVVRNANGSLKVC